MFLCFEQVQAETDGGLSSPDMEDYGFEYSDEEQEEQDVDIENQYYNSKGKLHSTAASR